MAKRIYTDDMAEESQFNPFYADMDLESLGEYTPYWGPYGDPRRQYEKGNLSRSAAIRNLKTMEYRPFEERCFMCERL